MNVGVTLRGHHLLCLLGYRGMGYSEAYQENMTKVYNRLRDEPSTMITIVEGQDDLCVCYPLDGEWESHCENASVAQLDEQVLKKLGLGSGHKLQWAEVVERVREGIVPEDINDLCKTCQWRSYGVCEAGVRAIKQGEWLPPLP